MSCKPGATRQGGVVLVIAALLLVFSGVVAGGAVAKPDKQPDTTLDDHPSGKDRTAEAGKSGTQGKSTSDPDGMANGGADKPGGSGGFDADKDGNNGCGNDDDFEDDNNGNCGGRVRGANAQGGRHQSEVKSNEQSKVQGEVVQLDTTTESVKSAQGTAAVQAVEETRVLGVSLVREQPAAAVSGTAAAAPAALAATGAPAVELLAIALVLIVLGALFVAGARRRETTLA